jgi:hypothetical protein
MSQSLLHLICADLHPGCTAHLHGATVEELLLAYVAHRCGGRVVGTLVLEDLLSRVRTTVVPQPARPAVGSRAGALVG